MANPLMSVMGGQMQGGNGIFQRIVNFKDELQGRDPKQVIDQMLQSGQMTQEQYQKFYAQAQQMSSMFGNMGK